jgi:cyclic beta-1,2-glucan synthetase
LYTDPALRPAPDVLANTPLGRPTLWAEGISGDLPIVLARIDDHADIDIIRQLLRAHEYWRLKQVAVDVVIINEKAASYIQEFQNSLDGLVHGSQLRLSPDGGAAGRIYLLRGDLISQKTRAQLQAAARVVLLSRRGTLAEQINRARHMETATPVSATVPLRPPQYPDVPVEVPPRQYFNGLGGFANSGREYVIVLRDKETTPEPWINVMANPNFGFITSESGSGFTWSLNSHENQLTPWSNDHVMDPVGEAIYLRDDNSGEIWTPTALPIRQENATYVTRHGQGYSRFTHGSHGILADLTQFVPAVDPVKISFLTLQNETNRVRRITVTAYAEWLIGSSPAASRPYIATEKDVSTGAIFARNLWQGDFGGRIAFADLAGRQEHFTTDRAEFLGRNGSTNYPLALHSGKPLSGKVGAGLDPCAALQVTLELPPRARLTIRFLLGEANNADEARTLIARYRTADGDKILAEATKHWDNILETVQVKTPEPAWDLILNRWLLYQTLSCRMWGRAGFYQLSGAYGFRDQIQDGMALTVAHRDVTRAHLLRAAAHQFSQGDVQHWWHPPTNRGIRTRISDDLVWLPYAVINFLEVTGDWSVLDETVPFLEGNVLEEDQYESYFEARTSDERASLFEHCARALDRSLKVGSHGLPLMGTGDWNDGMNRVGQEGKGESIWLGWFLHTVLWEFAKIADRRGERKRAENWRLHVSALKAAIEREGWNGEWYLRAYYDDGTPLGAAADTECRIDSIAQTWGVLSGAAEPARRARAMAAVYRELIRPTEGLVLLLSPPFNHTPKDPGYIKGYLPGIRENGGQYTHAAIWTLMAFAAMGDGDRAGEIFNMINPIRHSDSQSAVLRYKVEPYVVAGDIYAEGPHVGRGGWTWYTGSAGWLYRAGIEWILGFRVHNASLSIDPCIPRNWRGYSVTFRYHSSLYEIRVENPSGVARGVVRIDVEGHPMAGTGEIHLLDDGITHHIRVVMGLP